MISNKKEGGTGENREGSFLEKSLLHDFDFETKYMLYKTEEN